MNTLVLKLFINMQAFMSREQGQSLVEYGLIVALIALGTTTAMQTLGQGLDNVFTNVSSSLASSLT